MAAGDSSAADKSPAELAWRSVLDDFGAQLADIDKCSHVTGTATSKDKISLLCWSPASAASPASSAPPSWAAHRVELPLNEASVALLRSACEPARFGLGRDYVYDASVRSALSLPPRCFALDAGSASSLLPSPELLGRIASVLTPNLGRGALLRCVPINLNVYAKGDFFKEHQDTPHRGLVASLVLRLPSEYTGGALVLRRGEQEVARIFDGCSLAVRGEGGGGGGGSGDDLQRTVDWAAFPPDMRHEIEPVTSGNRVTIAFGLYAPVPDAAADAAAAQQQQPPSLPVDLPPPPPPAAVLPQLGDEQPPSALRVNRARAALERLIASGRHRSGALLGVPCRHSYGRGGASVSSRSGSPSPLRPELLVGADAEVFLAAEQLGLKPQLFYVFNCDTNYSYEYDVGGQLLEDGRKDPDGSMTIPDAAPGYAGPAAPPPLLRPSPPLPQTPRTTPGRKTRMILRRS